MERPKEEAGDGIMETGGCEERVTSPGMQVPPGDAGASRSWKRQGDTCCPGAAGGTSPAHVVMLAHETEVGLLASRTHLLQDNKCVLFSAMKFGVLCYGRPRKLLQAAFPFTPVYGACRHRLFTYPIVDLIRHRFSILIKPIAW